MAKSDAEGRAVFSDSFEGECLIQAVRGDEAIESVYRKDRESFVRTEITRVDAVAGEITDVEVILWTPFTIRGNVRTPEFHSDSMEPMFVQSAGLKVVMPATAYDAKGLLLEAIRDRGELSPRLLE